MTGFPEARTKADYAALLERRETAFGPAVRGIAARHGLPLSDLEPLPVGTNVVWRAGSRVIKAYPPLWPREARAERAMLAAAEGRLGIETPRLDAEGEVEGWRYLVLSRLEGREARQVWRDVPEADRRAVVEDVGRALARLHALDVPDLAGIERWPDVVAAQRAGWTGVQRARGMTETWIEEGEAFLDRLSPVVASLPTSPVHADVTWENVFLSLRAGRWRATGLLDFADALRAPREYELAMPPTHWLPVRPLLRAYGFGEDALTPGLSDRLLACALLHRFIRVPGEAARTGGLSAVRAALYGFAGRRSRRLTRE